jgi:DNA polymerase-3 subunit epsilon
MRLRRGRLARSAGPGALRDFYDAPVPPGKTDWRRTSFLAVDLETTGRDPGHDQIVSAGWVRLQNQAIVLGSADHRILRTSIPMPEPSAVLHAITDDESARGETLPAMLAALLGALKGCVLIAHYAATEIGFLDAACKHVFGTGLSVPTVDTLVLARQSYARRVKAAPAGALRLGALREQYNLPPHAVHDALGDAIATAELFLAQMADRSGSARVPLQSIVARD